MLRVLVAPAPVTHLAHRPSFRLLGLTFIGAAVAATCFIESSPSAVYRFTCEQASDCGEGESCIAGLCQIACTAQTAADVCPPGRAGPGPCINGSCANACTPSDDHCPDPQSCLPLDEIAAVTLGAFGADAVCTVACTATSCGPGESCQSGVCLPGPGGDPPDDTGDTGDTSGPGETGSTGNTGDTSDTGSTTGRDDHEDLR